MKTCFLLLLSVASAAAQASGGAWTLRSSTHDSGGGSVSGSSWAITATLGQPDASSLNSTATPWTAQGGFWPTAIQQLGGPVLTITPLGVSRFTIAWSADAVGYKLQSSSDLITWTDFTGLTITGPSNTVWNLSNGPRYFFRLKKL